MNFDAAQLIEPAINTIRAAHRKIQKRLQLDPQTFLSPKRFVGGKQLLNGDLIIEEDASYSLRNELSLNENKLLVLGEERLGTDEAKKIDLTNERRLVVLMDMIDGTDLLARGLGNWCSAMVFFDPRAKRNKILASFVGIPDDGVYYATKNKPRPSKYQFHVKRGEDRTREIEGHQGTSRVEKAAEASICFYGQQIKNLTGCAEQRNLVQYLDTIYDEYKDANQDYTARIYNFAGMPMMMKMIDGPKRIDAVLDANSQWPHDMIAGAFIALKAGAVLSDLNGAPIDLETSLLHPADPEFRLKYILASTEPLRQDLQRGLNAASTKATGGRVGNPENT